ncbi:hypothetical protein THRCLA_04900 [Thraustotheca clavata]|uniref:Uncharacterized protein n=1 Tax=Thraustotheca clavata TaxID=74557 RepID=A0A1V9ZXL8_9STRA|nr:hypothetical protein THRCLA_04900 [Thraustotheca clavata]
MWMQQSMEGGRNHSHQGGGYGGQPSAYSRPKDEDWKTRLVEGGQWLGEKVMSLASASTSSHDNGIGNRSYNDGRANWMAEIRNNTGSYSNSHSGGYNAGGYNAGGYQNDFATERPGNYSDSRPYTSDSNVTPYSDSNYRSQMQSFTYESKPSKKSSKKSNQKKHKKKVVSSSEESESSSASSSESESESEESDVKSKKKKDLKKKNLKRMDVSSDGGSTDTAPETKPAKKTKAKRVGLKSKNSNYSYSLDTSRVTAVAAEEPTKSKRVGKKTKEAKKNAPAPVVDLLGVESLTISNSPAQTPFEQPAAQPLSTIDQLAGLSFDMPVQSNQSYDVLGMGSQPNQQPLLGQTQSQMPQTNSFMNSNFQQSSHQSAIAQEQQKPVSKPQPTGFIVPGSDLVDLRTQSEVSKAKVASDPRSLNELQQLNSHPPPQPVMPPPPQPTMGMMQPMMAMQPYMLQQGGYPGYHPHDPNAQRNMMLMMQQQQQQQMTPGFF